MITGRIRWHWVVCLGVMMMFNVGCYNRYSQQTVIKKPMSPFNGKRAFEDLQHIVAIGPRDSGSEGMKQQQAYIKEALSKAGLEVREQAFEVSTPVGKKAMLNLTGVVKGSKPGVIILGNHYDTKYFPKFTFVGANDGGSTTAWMMEMARTLGAKREGRSVWLCFFDGEEAFKDWSSTDSLYGSRAYVEQLKRDNVLSTVQAMINVDMIGDKYLQINRDSAAQPWLTDVVWSKAEELEYGQYFSVFGQSVEDDHAPFRKAGIPAMDIIDFTYGENMIEHVRNWHTERDTLDKVSSESLQVVGDVIYHSLAALEQSLDNHGRK